MLSHNNSLSEFDTYQTEDSDYTHRRHKPFDIKLNLSSCIDEFWYAYCSSVQRLEQNGSNEELSYLEKGSDHTPVNVTLVFKYDLHDRIDYSPYFIASLVALTQHSISEVYDLQVEGSLYCAVLFGDNQYTDAAGEYCHVVSLRFPRCVVSTNSQTTRLRDRLIDNFRKSNLIGMIPTPKNIDFFSILSKSPPMGDWALFGSVDPHTKAEYRLEYLLMEIPLQEVSNASSNEEFDLTEYSITLETTDVLDPRNHSDCRRYGFDPLSQYSNHEFWLPLILSVGFCDIRTKVKVNRSGGSVPVIKTPSVDTDVCIAQTLLGMIKARCREDWSVIGMAMYHGAVSPIFTPEEGLTSDLKGMEQMARDQWNMHLKRHGYEDLSYLWGTSVHKDSCFTLRTIAWMAQEDSPEEFRTWRDEWIHKPIRRAIERVKLKDHVAMAEAFYRCFWLEYAYTEIRGTRSSGLWYRYKHHHWNQICDTEMSEPVGRFRGHIGKIIANMSNTMAMAHEQNEKDLLNGRIKLATELYDVLGRNNWINDIIKASKQRFLISNFDTLANANKCLTGVRNGVIEVTDKTAFFRTGRPEDYLTKFTNVRYEDMEHDPLLSSYLEYIHQVFPDKELADLMLRFFASLLYGNPDKLFHVWTGVGDNGKSTIVKLLNATLGDDYVANIPPTFITMKRNNSSSASPELAALRHARLVVIQEPDEGEQLKSGKIKEATGGDKIRARALFENGGPIDPTYKIVLQCNEIPEAKKEQAMTNRIMIIPFLSVWKDPKDIPENPEEARRNNIFKKDITFMSTVQKFSTSCLYMMVKYFPHYRERPINGVPAVVTEHTNQYWNKVDIYQRFMHDRLEYVYLNRLPNEEPTDKNSPFKLDPTRQLDFSSTLPQYDLYREFVSWFKDTGRFSRNGGEIPIYDKVIEQYTKYLGEPDYIHGWKGIRIRLRGETIIH